VHHNAGGQLEVRLGLRAEGLVLPECGPGVVTLANVLKRFIHSFPDSVLPMLWLTDVMKAAKDAIVTAGMQVCHITFRCDCYQQADWVVTSTSASTHQYSPGEL
jgi:hypothetical protein